MVLNGYKASSRSTCQMVLTELVEIRIPSQSRGRRRKGPDCRNSSKNAWPGTALVIQWLESTCQGWGHGFDPCSGKIQNIFKKKKKKPDLEVEGVCGVNPSTSSNVGEVCTHLTEMGLEEKHWPHSWVDVMWTQTQLQKPVFGGDMS